jgi:hypothetical protein
MLLSDGSEAGVRFRDILTKGSCIVLRLVSRLPAPPSIPLIIRAMPCLQHGLRVWSNCSSCWAALLLLPNWPSINVLFIPEDCKYASTLSSLTFHWVNRLRSFLFSSAALLAAVWISDEASIPWSSSCRNRVSSSWRYSFRRARERLWLSRIRARFAFSYEVIILWIKYLDAYTRILTHSCQDDKC